LQGKLEWLPQSLKWHQAQRPRKLKELQPSQLFRLIVHFDSSVRVGVSADQILYTVFFQEEQKHKTISALDNFQNIDFFFFIFEIYNLCDFGLGFICSLPNLIGVKGLVVVVVGQLSEH
jgi:hypothetical protein